MKIRNAPPVIAASILGAAAGLLVKRTLEELGWSPWLWAVPAMLAGAAMGALCTRAWLGHWPRLRMRR